MSQNLKKYIGLDYEKVNCFDLVKLFYKEQFNAELKNYFEGEVVPDGADAQNLIISNKGDFVKVNNPQFGDIMVIKLYGYESHLGVCLNKLQFLHTIKTSGSVVETIKKYERLIVGYYRLKGAK